MKQKQHQNNWDTNILSNTIKQNLILIKPLQNDDKSNVEHPSFGIYDKFEKIKPTLMLK